MYYLNIKKYMTISEGWIDHRLCYDMVLTALVI